MNLHHDKEAFEELLIGAANENITVGLLFVPETYDTVIQSVKRLADSGIWN